MEEYGGKIHVFWFGTLSSMVSHHVGGGDDGKGTSYVDLPDWAEVNTPLSLRDITEKKGEGSDITKGGKGSRIRDITSMTMLYDYKEDFGGGFGFFK